MTTRTACACAALVGALALSGCEVTNPGPIQDDFLNDPSSYAPLVRGAERQLVQGVDRVALLSALPAREIFPSGQGTGGLGNIVSQAGQILPEHTGSPWSFIQQGRWIAEDAVRRLTKSGTPVDPTIVGQAYVWAGYANRVLGEIWCAVTIDGGPRQTPEDALKRAEAQFTSALGLAINQQQKYAAYAGRAQVRLALGRWAEAAQDAGQVPADFVLQVRGDNGSDLDIRNQIYFADANAPYRNFSMHFTYFYDYYKETGDPRAAWESFANIPYANGSWPGYGLVPWSRPLKHSTPDYPFTLASGREMLLIRAEAILAQTPANWAQALALVNQVHTSFKSKTTGQPLAPWNAGSLADAWTALMAERSVELLLEGRRLFDIRRWEIAKVPGNMNVPRFETKSTIFTTTPQSRCFPIPQGELDANPNLK